MDMTEYQRFNIYPAAVVSDLYLIMYCIVQQSLTPVQSDSTISLIDRAPWRTVNQATARKGVMMMREIKGVTTKKL